MGPYGVQISKRYSSHSYVSFSTTHFQKIPSDYPLKSWYLFLKFRIWKFLRQIEIFINMGSYGSENFKTLLLPQFRFFSTKLFVNVPCDNPHKTWLLEFWNFVFKLFLILALVVNNQRLPYRDGLASVHVRKTVFRTNRKVDQCQI